MKIDLPKTLGEGRYILGAELGEGGMAVVVQATDTVLKVVRAIKVLQLSGKSASPMRKRLEVEARAMAQIHHPNVLSVHDIGFEGDLAYVVMDLAAGGSMEDRLAKKDFTELEAVGCIVSILSALVAAHDAGIVHRDVKPHNILLDGSGRPLLADFGIARIGEERHTRTGVAMGSLSFMPPEQRLDAARVGPPADVYATGTTLYNLVTNENPMDLFMAEPSSDRWLKVPEALRPILQRATQARPRERFESAAAFRDALLAVYAGRFVTRVPLSESDVAEPEMLHEPASTFSPETLIPVEVPPQGRDGMMGWMYFGIAGLVAGLAMALLTLTVLRPSLEAYLTEVPVEVGSSSGSLNVPDPDAKPTESAEPTPETAPAPVEPTQPVEPDSTTPQLAAPEPVRQVPDEVRPPAPAPTPTERSEPEPEEPAPLARVDVPVIGQERDGTKRTEPAGALPVAGTWKGSRGGFFVTLQVSGRAGSVLGSVTTSRGAKTSTVSVEGTYNEPHLQLRETGVSSPASYGLRFDGVSTLSGTVTSGGRTQTLAVERR